MVLNILIFFVSILPVHQDYKEINYEIEFIHVDNKIDIIVNDSLVYTTGKVDHNPDFGGDFSFYLGPYLTDGPDDVIIRLYNGFEPYESEQNDKHWEVEYVIKKGKLEYDYMWDEGDDYRTGMVFEEKYVL